MKNILLIGAGFKNKGAEAMALTAIMRFHQLYPGCKITMASYHQEQLPYGIHSFSPPSEDGEIYRFELIHNPQKRHHLLHVPLYWLLPFLPLRNRILKHEPYLQRFAQADLVVDLSGFALSDQQPFITRLSFCFEIFTSCCMGKPFVIFTQALGPFEKVSTRLLAKLFLPKVDLLIARGQKTYKYLKQLGITRRMEIPICADSAFLFPSAPSDIANRLLGNHAATDRPLFGILSNINIFHRTQPSNDHNSYIQILARLCDYVHAELGAEVVFICHERREQGQKDDEWLTHHVIKQTKNPHRIGVITADHPASELKAVIGRLDFIVASRFHSIVGAMSMATPFLVLSWAHKYDELVADVQMEDRVFDIQHLSVDSFFETLRKEWDRKDTIRARLTQHYLGLRSSADRAFQLVADKWPDR